MGNTLLILLLLLFRTSVALDVSEVIENLPYITGNVLVHSASTMSDLAALSIARSLAAKSLFPTTLRSSFDLEENVDPGDFHIAVVESLGVLPLVLNSSLEMHPERMLVLVMGYSDTDSIREAMDGVRGSHHFFVLANDRDVFRVVKLQDQSQASVILFLFCHVIRNGSFSGDCERFLFASG